jgi:hypothetical protein
MKGMNMTIEQVAAVMLRIAGIGWFIEVLVAMTLLPGEILGMLSQTGYLATQRELAFAVVLLRIFLYFALGMAFVFFSRPLAKLITKGLMSESPVSDED